MSTINYLIGTSSSRASSDRLAMVRSIHMLYSLQRGEELLDKGKVTGKEGASQYIYRYEHYIYIYVDL